MKPTLFISDLHLDPRRPAITTLFQRFLTERASAAGALYILGDLFEAWIGDDDDSALAADIASALSALSRRGVPVYFVHGNRDFLLGERYAAACGMTLLAETTVIDLYGTPTLLMHGDTLCTDDVAYQAFRTQVRSPLWQAAMLSKPLAERRALAAQLRSESAQATQQKGEYIMDANADTVRHVLRAHGVQRLIHGHTHRPAVHHFDLDGAPAERIVLGDWYEQGSVLCCDTDGLCLETLSPAA